MLSALSNFTGYILGWQTPESTTNAPTPPATELSTDETQLPEPSVSLNGGAILDKIVEVSESILVSHTKLEQTPAPAEAPLSYETQLPEPSVLLNEGVVLDRTVEVLESISVTDTKSEQTPTHTYAPPSYLSRVLNIFNSPSSTTTFSALPNTSPPNPLSHPNKLRPKKIVKHKPQLKKPSIETKIETETVVAQNISQGMCPQEEKIKTQRPKFLLPPGSVPQFIPNPDAISNKILKKPGNKIPD